jgi:rhamnulose-1-phosphate aldolase/alcohol dehydrogenase
MRSRWSEREAEEFRERYAEHGEQMGLRVYSSRLIGAEPDLVLHGGGNTSLKASARDLFGHEIDVLYVKGSGWDLESIEPAGLPAVRLAELRRLRELEALDDETMVEELRRALLHPASAPNPSVETLLHAFLPHRYVDHSHADAILALTNQPDARERIRTLFGERVAFVPYVMAGFALARLAAEIYEKSPDVEGLVLEKHGLFTFAEDARASYERHVALVDRAERLLAERLEGRRLLGARPVVATSEPGDVAPLVRGALAEATGDPDRPHRRFVLEHRSSEEILHFAAAELGPELAAAPPITPDHVIRTKGRWLFVRQPAYREPDALRAQLDLEVAAFRDGYRAYFARHASGRVPAPRPLDPTPRVVILPGIGLFAAGETRRAARIAADIAEHSIRTKIRAATIGRYEGISERDLFDMEYWSLEQAKLGRRTPAPLEGQVALVTGGAGAIGEGIARRVLAAGGGVVLVDVDGARLEAVGARLGSADCELVEADVTSENEMRRAFREASAAFGGVDLVVANAGVAAAGALEELDADAFERAIRVNLRGAFLTLREGVRSLRRQGTGGNVVLVSTKNVFAPGARFGAYSASKAGAHQLGKIAAIEAAPYGIRVNMLNADAVFGSDENPSGLWAEVGPARAAAHGVEPSALPEFYRDRNLLRARVTADHVGNAVVFLATQQTPTTGAAIPIDGGIPEAFPR